MLNNSYELVAIFASILASPILDHCYSANQQSTHSFVREMGPTPESDCGGSLMS